MPPPAAELDSIIDASISSIIKSLADGCNNSCGFGSMSVSLYDTAWLANVSRKVDGVVSWIFPECFQYVLDCQLPDGGWTSYASQIDGILNTMGGLLVLLRREVAIQTVLPQLADHPNISDLRSRVLKAKESLHLQLQTWNIDACNHVGFEYIVPALLRMLEAHGAEFVFPGMQKLLDMNAAKMARFDPGILYGPTQTTALHSLEAFVDVVDFDRVAHHKINGSIMASPASTAAYLMFRSEWDSEAELYLKSVIENGAGRGNGGVPSAFPTTIFEATWVISTLLRAGFTPSSLSTESSEIISRFIEKELQARNGIIGFAPQILPDADDTAKSILTLNLLGKSTSQDGMIAKFEGSVHFKTYDFERNPSFSANCNVLDALLHDENPSRYHSQITKTVNFLCTSYNAGKIADKWNLSPQYSVMLLAYAFKKLIALWDQGKMPLLSLDTIRDQVMLTLFQITYRTLANQNLDGSWGIKPCCEETAYAVLTLADASDLELFWTESFNEQMYRAIELGGAFLANHRDEWTHASYTWIEKVTYKSEILSKVYSMAAYNVASRFNGPTKMTSHSNATSKIQGLGTSPDIIYNTKRFFSNLPIFENGTIWRLEASAIEGLLYLPSLRRVRLDVFPRTNMGDDKYLDYIPFTWIACNSKANFPIKPGVLWDMIVISMLNYQADEFMETIKDIESASTRRAIRATINKLLVGSESRSDGELTPDSSDSEEADSTDGVTSIEHLYTKTSVTSVEGSPGAVLERFVRHVLNHPKIAALTPPSALTHLIDQLRRFLLAHVDHSADNSVLAQRLPQFPVTVFPSKKSFYHWIHGTSSINTSCPYSFAWLMCRIGSVGHPSPMTKYLEQDLAIHLAAMCRMYNDYGSLARDVAEANLNSLNFPEFQSLDRVEEVMENTKRQGLPKAKEALMHVAEYERSLVMMAKARLLPFLSKEVGDTIGVFIDVTDLYGQMYVAKDTMTRMR